MRKVNQVIEREPEKPESALVESGDRLVQQSARSLKDAADGPDDPVQALGAMNGVTPDISSHMDEINDHDEISRLAYTYYLERGDREGSPDEDWHRAEQEYRSRRKP